MSLLSGRKILIPALSIFSFFISCGTDDADTDYAVWNIVGGNSTGNKYSSLSQIDTSNVHQLKVAWTYHTGDADTAAHSQIQCNPIVIKGILYCTSPALKLIALDAATGKEIWKFSPFANDSIH